MPRSLIAVVTLTLLIAAAGCGDARKGDLSESRFRQEPDLARGRVAFMHHCNECHVQGGPGLGPGIIDKPLPAVAIKTQVRVGAGTMPAFAKEKLSDEDLNALVRYLGVLKAEGTPLAAR